MSANPAFDPSKRGSEPMFKSKETRGSLWFSERITVIPFAVVKTSESLMLIFFACVGAGITDRST